MNSNRGKRYFGMTSIQLVLVIVLACIACALLVANFIYLPDMLSNQTTWSLYAVPGTSTLPTTISPVPTLTETPASRSTTIPYNALIPTGWNQYSDSTIGYEIWFPSEYEPRDPESMLEQTIQYYLEVGDQESAQNLQNELTRSLDKYTLWMVDSLPSALLYQTNISLLRTPQNGISLDLYIDDALTKGSESGQLLERKTVQLDNYLSQRLWLETRVANTSVAKVIYFIQERGFIWTITCSVQFNEFYTRLPVFDQIVGTFRTGFADP